jgi:hypothetical protein
MKLCTFAWNVWDGGRPIEVRESLCESKLDLYDLACRNWINGKLRNE